MKFRTFFKTSRTLQIDSKVLQSFEIDFYSTKSLYKKVQEKFNLSKYALFCIILFKIIFFFLQKRTIANDKCPVSNKKHTHQINVHFLFSDSYYFLLFSNKFKILALTLDNFLRTKLFKSKRGKGYSALGVHRASLFKLIWTFYKYQFFFRLKILSSYKIF